MDMAIVVNQVDEIDVYVDGDGCITISQRSSDGDVQLVRFHSESAEAVINGIRIAQIGVKGIFPAQPCGRVG